MAKERRRDGSAGSARHLKRATGPAALLVAIAIAAIAPSGASAANSLAVHGSVNQVYVTGAPAGHEPAAGPQGQGRLEEARSGRSAGSSSAGSPAGKGYRVRAADGSLSRRIAVMSERPPKNTSIYNQTLPAGGYGYLYTRDGTSLALDVRLPGPAVGRALPDPGRVLGLRLREPGRRGERDQPDRSTCSATRSST